MTKIKTLIVDDHQVVLDGIQSMLDQDAEIAVVKVVINAESALDFLKSNTVNVAIVDVNLPGMDGLELCKIITKKYVNTKVLALTTFNESSIISGMMKNGASGYLLKNTSSTELIEAVKAVNNGAQYLAKEVQEKLISSTLGQQSSSYIPKLTRREKEVLKLITEEFTTNEIAEKLFISKATVETHRLHLLSKLDVRNTAGLVKVAIQKGLV